MLICLGMRTLATPGQLRAMGGPMVAGDTEKLERLLLGRKIVGVHIDPTQSGPSGIQRGSISLAIEGVGVVRFGASGTYPHYTVVALNDVVVIRT